MLFAAGHARTTSSVLNTYTAETGLPIDYSRERGGPSDGCGGWSTGARMPGERPSTVPLSDLLVVVGRVLD